MTVYGCDKGVNPRTTGYFKNSTSRLMVRWEKTGTLGRPCSLRRPKKYTDIFYDHHIFQGFYPAALQSFLTPLFCKQQTHTPLGESTRGMPVIRHR